MTVMNDDMIYRMQVSYAEILIKEMIVCLGGENFY